MWLPERGTEKPKSHIMMVFALSVSLRAHSACLDANDPHSTLARSSGSLVSGLTMASGSSMTSPGLLLHSLSSANPNGASACEYMAWPPDFATDKPKNHITVLSG